MSGSTSNMYDVESSNSPSLSPEEELVSLQKYFVNRDPSISDLERLKTFYKLLDSSRANNFVDLPTLLFYVRNPRGGLGKTDVFVSCFNMLAHMQVGMANILINHIPTYGCYKDFLKILRTPANYLWVQATHEKIINKFAEDLVLDYLCVEGLNSYVKDRTPSYAAKWAPRENLSFHKKNPKIFKKIVSRVFTTLSEIDTDGSIIHSFEIKKPIYIYRQICSKINNVIGTNEILMCSGRYSEIDYNSIPNGLRTLRKDALKNSNAIGKPDRIKGRELFMSRVVPNNHPQLPALNSVTKKLLIGKALKNLSPLVYQKFENQFKEMISIYHGRMKTRVVPVIDFSNTMFENYGDKTPFSVASAVALVMSSFHEGGAFLGKILTCESIPRWVKLNARSNIQKLRSLVRFNKNYKSEGKVSLAKILDVILNKLIRSGDTNVPNICVITCSDVLDQGSIAENDVLLRRYIEHGLRIPKILVWNVNSNESTITQVVYGLYLMNGFSFNQTKFLFDFDLEAHNSYLRKILSSDVYQPVNDSMMNYIPSGFEFTLDEMLKVNQYVVPNPP